MAQKDVTIVKLLRGTAIAILLALGLALVATAPAAQARTGSTARQRSESARTTFPVTRVVTERQGFRPLVIGHRGEPARAPEETIPSFQAAVDDQADVLEFDVRWTRDDAMVAMHDATLDRTTDCTGPVTSKTLAEVRACDAGSWLGPAWVGTQVPTMAEVVALAKRHAVRIAPEIKQASVSQDQVAAFARVISDAGMQDSTVVQSFSPASIALYRAAQSGVPVGYITSRAPQTVETVLATGAEYYIVDYPSITAAQVREFQAAGVRVWLYTVTGPTSNDAAVSRYPDGIITNDTVLTRTGLP